MDISIKKKNTCAFCNKKSNEFMYGPLYTLENVTVHYYCVLLSNKIKQQGADNEGVLGFLLSDIKAELKRSIQDNCFYCGKKYASLHCSKCKKIFHLPCGLKNGSLSQFFGEFKNFCSKHRPIQKIPKRFLSSKAICSLCYNSVCCKDTNNILWAPCCKKTWYHRKCIQKHACSAGYLFRCAICSNKHQFKKCMLQFGIFIPQKDASWELEPNAYEELLFRYNQCDADECKCPDGREKNIEDTMWEIILCQSCGSQGIHIFCGKLKFVNPEWECLICKNILGNQLNRTNSVQTFKSAETVSGAQCSSKLSQKPPFSSDNFKTKEKLINVSSSHALQKKRKTYDDLIHIFLPDKRKKNDNDSEKTENIIDIETVETIDITKGSSSSSFEHVKRMVSEKKASDEVNFLKDNSITDIDSSDSECKVVELSDSSDGEIEVIEETIKKNFISRFKGAPLITHVNSSKMTKQQTLNNKDLIKMNPVG